MRIYGFFIFLSLFVSNAYCDELDAAISNVRQNCTGISDRLSDLKKMAGINTAVTGVGTAAATGATIVGIVKTSTDKDLEMILSRVDNKNGSKNPSAGEVMSVYDKYIDKYGDIGVATDTLQNKSKTLGNWRTGLIAGGTATNVVGAVIAGNNRVDTDLQTQISNCTQSVDLLKNIAMPARFDGIDTGVADKIITECGQYKNADLSVINNRARGALISSVIGAATGVAGTLTSGMANTDNVRNGNDGKEKNLNTAANVLAGGTAVASGAATVFNATQISAIKKIVNIADNCEKVLQ